MNTTVSSKYQIVIPKAVRKQLDIKPGQKLQVSASDDGTILIQKDTELDMDAFLDKYSGILKHEETAWGKAGMDATDWLRQQRDSDDWR